MIYYGHEGGDMEKDAVLAFSEGLASRKLCHHALSTPTKSTHRLFGHGEKMRKE